MRKFLASGCCAVYVAFGFVAGAAHVHGSADHHEQTRGLHLGHAHLHVTADHDRDHHTGHGSHDHGDAGLDARHVAHHDGDALYLTATALRSSDSSHRPAPAIVSGGATLDPPAAIGHRDDSTPGPPRDPPRSHPIRPRAPPA